MKLEIQKRETGKKGIANKLRRDGYVPAVLYGFNQVGTPIYLKADEIGAVLRNMKPGLLATTLFELHEGTKKHKAIVKDVQYHVTGYDLVHIDFMQIAEDKPVTVNVPIQVTGAADCVGIKLGGFLRQVMRTVKVSCLPKDIPQSLTIDVAALDVGQSKTLADIAISPHIRLLTKNGVVAAIGKKAGAA